MAKSDKPDYVLIYDGEGGVRMAPAGARIDVPPEGHISWPSERETTLALETATVAAPRRPAYVLPALGAVCLCVIGLGLGLAARPDLSAIAKPKPAPMRPAPSQTLQPTDAQMQVMVLAPPPAPVSAPASGAARLEVLPADQRRGAAPAVPAAAPAAPPLLQVTAPAHPVASQAAATDASAIERDDCRDAGSPAEIMVCRDPDLTRADRRLARAFRAAARSGVPLGQLRAEQDDWLDIREDAAERSPRAVAQIYDQRIEELEAMAAAAEPR